MNKAEQSRPTPIHEILNGCILERRDLWRRDHGTKPKYALVEAGGKKAIIKINDVGPLKPGRIIDFNERTMRYFDPTLQQGVIHTVSVTPLPGDRWTAGPIAENS